MKVVDDWTSSRSLCPRRTISSISGSQSLLNVTKKCRRSTSFTGTPLESKNLKPSMLHGTSQSICRREPRARFWRRHAPFSTMRSTMSKLPFSNSRYRHTLSTYFASSNASSSFAHAGTSWRKEQSSKHCWIASFDKFPRISSAENFSINRSTWSHDWREILITDH